MEEHQDTSCVICMTHIKEVENKLMVLRCGHVYCVGCIFPLWISYLIMRFNRLNKFSTIDDCGANNNKCPVCRKETFKIIDQVDRNQALNITDYPIRILNF